MAQLVEAKREGEDAHELLVPDTTEPDADGDVADLLAALRKSVETAQSRRGSASQETEPPAEQAGQEDASQEDRRVQSPPDRRRLSYCQPRPHIKRVVAGGWCVRPGHPAGRYQ